MAVSAEYRAFLEEQLGRVEPVVTKHMFGGLSVYARGVTFAIAADNVLYFKEGAANLADFEARNCEPFRPYGDERTMAYREVPGDVLEDMELLEDWVGKAITVALDAKVGRKGKKGR